MSESCKLSLWSGCPSTRQQVCNLLHGRPTEITGYMCTYHEPKSYLQPYKEGNMKQHIEDGLSTTNTLFYHWIPKVDLHTAFWIIEKQNDVAICQCPSGGGTQSPEREASTKQDPLINRGDPSKQLTDALQCCRLFCSEITGSPDSPRLNKVAGRAWSFPSAGRKVAFVACLHSRGCNKYLVIRNTIMAFVNAGTCLASIALLRCAYTHSCTVENVIAARERSIRCW